MTFFAFDDPAAPPSGTGVAFYFLSFILFLHNKAKWFLFLLNDFCCFVRMTLDSRGFWRDTHTHLFPLLVSHFVQKVSEEEAHQGGLLGRPRERGLVPLRPSVGRTLRESKRHGVTGGERGQFFPHQ